MAGAIGLAFGRCEPAIGEVSASRIAQRPPTGEFPNVLEAQPSHLSDLGFVEGPGGPSARTGRETASGGMSARIIGVGPGEPDGRPLGPASADRRGARRAGAAPAAAELDSNPTRLADDRVSGSDAKRRSDMACALSRKSQRLEILDCLGGP